MANYFKQTVIIDPAPAKIQSDLKRPQTFSAAVITEFFMTVESALAPGGDKEAAIAGAFEELFRRLDFENWTVLTSKRHETMLAENAIQCGMLLLRFGNYLATKGIVFNEKISSSDH